MRISRIDIDRDDNILPLEIRPAATSGATDVLSLIDFAIQSEDNVSVLSTGTHSLNTQPNCQDGVCQLGDWKPNRDAA
jgi:hypothetical protein